MGYKKLIKALKCDGYGVGQDGDGCTNKRCKYRDSDGACNIVSMCEDAATAITDQLARAEAAEARAEKAERERDEYFNRLKGLCFCCGHRKDGFDCHAKCYGHKRGSAWVYEGQAKEE